jgi:hypothetical protein
MNRLLVLRTNRLNGVNVLWILCVALASGGVAENHSRYNRDGLRYPSDLTDAEWEYIKPLIPPAMRGGGKRRVNMREVINGAMYVLSTG